MSTAPLLLQIFATLRSVGPIADREALALHQSLSMRHHSRATWEAVMRNLHGEKALAAQQTDPQLEAYRVFVDNDVATLLGARQLRLEDLPAQLPGIGRAIFAISLLAHRGLLRKDQARKLLADAFDQPGQSIEDVAQHSSALDQDDGALIEQLAAQAVADDPQAVADVRAGKTKAMGALMGKVRRQIKADPRLIEDAILRLIQEA